MPGHSGRIGRRYDPLKQVLRVAPGRFEARLGGPGAMLADMEQRLSLITLGVSDVARARAFYEALGWSGESPDGDVVFFQIGGMVLALWGRDKLAEDSVVEDTGGWGGVTLAYCVYSPAEVDVVLGEAAEAGATIARAGAPTFWGGYSGIFIDPDGHPWEVAHNPGWVLASDGTVHLH